MPQWAVQRSRRWLPNAACKGMHSILDFTIPDPPQKCPFFNYTYLHRTARNLAAAFGALHARGYCIGDERVKYSVHCTCDTGRHRPSQGANLIKVLFTAALLVSLSSPHLNSRVRVFTQWIARSNTSVWAGSADFQLLMEGTQFSGSIKVQVIHRPTNTHQQDIFPQYRAACPMSLRQLHHPSRNSASHLPATVCAVV